MRYKNHESYLFEKIVEKSGGYLRIFDIVYKLKLIENGAQRKMY